MTKRPLTIGQCAALACLWEATAPKPGNVHRGADFEDLTYVDFATSAVLIAPAMERAGEQGLGQTVLAAVRATREAIGTNSNLGMILLLAPLAKIPRGVPLNEGIGRVLTRLDAEDSRLVYEAIRLARPGGLGRVEQDDVTGEAPSDLLAAMHSAAERDLVARQYANGFEEVLRFVLPAIERGQAAGWRLSDTIVHVFLELLSQFPDSLIARKCGRELAQQAADRAAAVLAQGSPGEAVYEEGLAELDFWLRCDQHRRNPGTSADLVAAGLFAALREGIIQPPYRW